MGETNTKETGTKLQNLPRRRGGYNAKNSETRKRFLYAYEYTGGNVSASCEYAGINRTTYYRWLASKSSLNRKFQKKLEKIKPKELVLDLAEGVLMQHLRDNNLQAAMFVLRRLGADRG